MYQTPTDKGKLSCSLKERLKRCGRYHASPSVAKQSEGTPIQTAYNDDPVPPSSAENTPKRQCLRIEMDGEAHAQDEDTEIEETASKSSLLLQNTPNVVPDADTNSKPVLTNLPQSDTPLQRRKSEGNKIKGNKLSFSECRREIVQDNQSSKETIEFKEETVELQELKTYDETCGATLSRSSLLKELKVKEEELRKLRMVKMYRTKNNLEELQTLIDKWRDVSQNALEDLLTAMSEPKPSLTQLIDHLGIDHELIRFNSEDDVESFY